jgi:hypothetical protein
MGERAWEQEGGEWRREGRLWGVAQVIPGAIALVMGIAVGYLAALAQVAHFVR